MLRILFTGGGSGGHIYPIVAIAKELQVISKNENIPLKLLFIGSSDFDREALAKEGMEVYSLPAGKIRRYPSLLFPLDAWKTLVGFFYSFFLLWWFLPNVIFSKGGYGSFAIAIVGRLYLIPLLVHESDYQPGLVNRMLGKIATKVVVSFPGSVEFFNPKKTVFIGNPVRKELKTGTLEEAKALFKLKGDKPIVLILGGSQGATRINKLIGESLHFLLLRYEIIHQCGRANVESFKSDLSTIYNIDANALPYYHLKGFFDEREQASALAAANFIISRAGAGSIYEIALAAKPALLIPLSESAGDHQRKNAFYYARIGAAAVVEQANLTPHILLNEIANILDNPEKIEKMVKAAQEFAKPDAAEKIARGLLELAKNR